MMVLEKREDIIDQRLSIAIDGFGGKISFDNLIKIKFPTDKQVAERVNDMIKCLEQALS